MPMESRIIRTLRKQGFLLLISCASLLTACIAFLPSATSKSEEERKWFLLGLVSSPEQNALISSPPTVGADGYDPALFTVDQREDQEEIAVPIYGKHYVSVGHIYDLDVDTSRIPGAPEEYESVIMPPGQFAEITYEYDEQLLRERGLIEEFQVFSYDERSGEWIPAIDVEVDIANNRVVARTNHFTPFVLTALPQPADGGVFTPPQCIVDALDDPAGSMPGPKWSRIDVGFKYYLDRGYTIKHNNAFYDLSLNESLGIATCNGGSHASSTIFCGPQGQHKYNTDSNYLDFQIPFNAKVYVMYDARGAVRANWLADMGFSQVPDTYIETTDEAQFYEVYEKDYASGSQVTLPGNHHDLNNPNQIRTNYFVAVLPQGDWAADAGIDCSGEPLRPASPEGISLIPGSDQIAIVLDQTMERDVTGLIVRRRLQEPSLSPEFGEAVGLGIEEPGYIIDSGLTEGMTYYYSFFAVTETGLYSPPLVLQVQTGPDDDGDGLANYYEINPSNVYYGGEGTKSNMEDTDSDGIDDLTEILHLTDPTNGDHTDPVVTVFEDDGTISTMPVARFNIEVDDESGITGWFLSTGTEPPANDSADWLTEEPTTWSVQELGELTLNLWVRDEAGNVSEMATLELDFPYFEYADSFMRWTLDPDRVIEYEITVQNLTGSGANSDSGVSPSRGLGFGQSRVMRLTESGKLRAYYFSAEQGPDYEAEFQLAEIFGPMDEFAPMALARLHYNAINDFWVAIMTYPFCPGDSFCLQTFRYDPQLKQFTSLSKNKFYSGTSGVIFPNRLDSHLTPSGRHFTLKSYYRFYGTEIDENGVLGKTYISESHLESGLGNDTSVVAFSNDLSWALLAGNAGNDTRGIRVLRYDESTALNNLASPKSVWPHMATYLNTRFFGEIQFAGDDRVLVCTDQGLELLQFSRATGNLAFDRVLISAPGSLEDKSLFMAADGVHFIFRDGSSAALYAFQRNNDSVRLVESFPGSNWSHRDQLTFSISQGGNQPPHLTIETDKGYPVVHPGGIMYPFSGVYTPGRDCADPSAFSDGYQSNPSSKWNMARIQYSDPDAKKCGVSDSPAQLARLDSSAPSASALETPMDIFPNLRMDTMNSWHIRRFMEDQLGPVGRIICPQALTFYGNNDGGIPLTPREAGDYSVTVAATDSRGTCEGRDQTATATLHLRARERHPGSDWELIRTDEYPEPQSDLLHFTLESDNSGTAKQFTRFRCQVNTVVCVRWGHLFACLPNSHLGLVNVAEKSDAKCGPPIFFMKRWVSPNGNAAPLSAYKPLRKYYYKADHYWNESWDQSVYNTINFEQEIDPFDTADFRGLLFIQTETMLPIETLYNGKWFGYEDL